jgi:DNA-binding response OmpR family regulator
MLDEQTSDLHDVAIAHVVYLHERSIRRERAARERRPGSPSSYRMKLGRETIWLNSIEYRIIRFLSAHPYRAFTRKRIAEAVHTYRNPVSEKSVDKHVASLREKLGFFADYIQTVPYLGYRFKA